MAERVDWVEIHDPRSGQQMFANIRTGECLWEAPSSAKVKKSSQNQWWELYDESTRRYYYYNAHTKQTEWRKPKESEIITLAKLQNLKGKGSKRRSSSVKKEGSQRRRGSSSARKDSGEPRSHHDGERGSSQRKYSRHNSSESLSQLRRHSRSSQSGQSKQSKGLSSTDGKAVSNSEQRKSETISRGEYETAYSSVELKEMSGGSTEEQIGQRRDVKKDNVIKTMKANYECDEMDHIQDESIADMDIGSCSQEMENTARNIEYLRITTTDIPDEPEAFNTAFSFYPNVISPTDNLSGRRSNCSVNQSNYVSDGPLSESETSALNDSFYSCDSKFEESNSEEKLKIIVTQKDSPQEENKDCLESGQDVPRTHSFFNKMLDEKGNLLTSNFNKDRKKYRHTSDGGNSGKAAALILRADKGGRRRSSSMDHKAYDNVSYSVYDNIGTAVDHDMADEDDISLSKKLTSGGMPHETAALVEACNPTQPELPTTLTEEESPARSRQLRQQLFDGNSKTSPPEENGGVGCQRGLVKPERPPLPSTCDQHRATKPIIRSNTCPVNQNRAPPPPPQPSSRNRFTDLGLSEQRRTRFGKKENLTKMLAHSKAPIKKPVINTSDKKLKKEAVELFKLVQIYMGDKSTRNKLPRDTMWEIVTKAWANVPLRDELYFQLIKQTTENNSVTSLKLGWELMAVCLAMFPPSSKYHSYLEGYVYKHLKDNQRQTNPLVRHELSNCIAQYAENCYYKLEKMAKTGSRKGQRQPTQEEVDAAKRAIFHPSMFGSTLDDTMEMQKSMFPDRQLPWILTCLTEQIIQHNGTCAEGIFRVPGDIDEVNALKVKTDKWTYPDDVNDPNVAASLLKQWFRDLREPLIDESAYERCISSCDDETVSRAIVFSLPKINQLVLGYIIKFLQIFCKRQVIEVTKMDVNNLAMVWAPNFLRCPSNVPQEIFDNTRKEMAFVRTLLKSLDTSFMDGIK